MACCHQQTLKGNNSRGCKVSKKLRAIHTEVALEEEPGIGLAEVLAGESLSEVIAGLNALGVAPRDMIDILKSIKADGALHAEFIVN